MTNTRERLGTMVGLLVAPLFHGIAHARRARVFHPEGVVLAARVTPVAADARARAAAERLAGPALVRFSTALWTRGKEWPDALGCAVRFRATEMPSADADDGDQDLLFATIPTPIATPIAPTYTAVHDFLANTYFATAPFDVRGADGARMRVKWRLVPERAAREGDDEAADRGEKLRRAVQSGHATLRLDARRTFHREWMPVARITLVREVAIDQERLRFFPFRDGRGIEPRGFVHALRRGAYRASQRGRPSHA